MALTFDTSMLELDEGLLNGVILQMEHIDDYFEKAIAEYDYPFADGADLEDMGQKVRAIRTRAYFWDNEEQQTYADHKALLDSLADKVMLDFVHPKYGLLKGKIRAIAVLHDDIMRKAILEITFLEQMRGTIAIAPAESVTGATEEAYIDAQEAQTEVLGIDIAAMLPFADSGVVTQILSAGQGLLDQIQGYTSTARLFVSGVEEMLSSAEAAVNQIVSPANSLQATMSYAATLPGRILGTLGRTLEKYGLLHESIKAYPSLYLSRINEAFDDLAADYATFSGSFGLTMQKHLLISSAQRLALIAAEVYATDEAAANHPENAEVEVMTINELETTLAIVRARLQAAIDEAREMESLKAMSAALLTQVNAVRLEREKMIRVTLDNPMPLHLVCLKYGLPYTDAERILRVNKIRNPNFTDGEVAVYAR